MDPQSRRDFWESLFALVARGTTILVSTHYIDKAERCHRLAILDAGRIAAEGEPKQLARDIDATVIEIGNVDFVAARRALAGVPEVRSIAQLGSAAARADAARCGRPECRIANALAESNPSAAVQQVEGVARRRVRRRNQLRARTERAA